jgi:hypothetical protein
MSDRRSEVPVWAFLNMQIVQEAVRSGDLDRAVRKIEERYELSPNSLRVINLAYVLSLLYCLVVVPKEIWAGSRLPDALAGIDADWLMSLVRIEIRSPDFDKEPVRKLIQHLRNALAHVRFEVNGEGDFTFWDQKNDQAPANFRATFTQNTLEQFISKVGAPLANLHFQNHGGEAGANSPS